MKSHRFFSNIFKPQLLSALVLLSLVLTPLGVAPASGPMAEVIVQAEDMASAEALVLSVGGTVTHELNIIDAVGAQLSPTQLGTLQRMEVVRVYEDGSAQVAGKPGPETFYPGLIDAALLHLDLDPPGAGIQAVLHQLLYHRRRPLHHLAGGDLID